MPHYAGAEENLRAPVVPGPGRAPAPLVPPPTCVVLRPSPSDDDDVPATAPHPSPRNDVPATPPFPSLDVPITSPIVNSPSPSPSPSFDGDPLIWIWGCLLAVPAVIIALAVALLCPAPSPSQANDDVPTTAPPPSPRDAPTTPPAPSPRDVPTTPPAPSLRAPPTPPSSPSPPPAPPRWQRRQLRRALRRMMVVGVPPTNIPPSPSHDDDDVVATTPPHPSATPIKPPSLSLSFLDDPLLLILSLVLVAPPLATCLLLDILAFVSHGVCVLLAAYFPIIDLAPQRLPRAALRPRVVRLRVAPVALVGKRALRGCRPAPPRFDRLRLCGDIHPNPGPPRRGRGGGRGAGRGGGRAAEAPPPSSDPPPASAPPPPAPPPPLFDRLLAHPLFLSRIISTTLHVSGSANVRFSRDTIHLGAHATTALPFVLHTDAVGAWSTLPVPLLPTSDSDRLLWLVSKEGRPALTRMVSRSVRDGATWMWRNEMTLCTAHRAFDAVRHIWFFPGDEIELSSDDESFDSSSLSSSSSESDTSDEDFVPSGESSSDQSDDDEEADDASARLQGPREPAHLPEYLTKWVATPMHWRHFAAQQAIPRKRWDRLYRDWIGVALDDAIVIPPRKASRCPPLCVRVRSTAFALRLVDMRASRMAERIAARRRLEEEGHPLRQRRRLAVPRVPQRVIQRGPVGVPPTLDPHPAPRVRGPVHCLYIDTCGGRIAGKRVTTAALRRCPPPAPLTSGLTASLAILAVWIGPLTKPLPQRFAQLLPDLPAGTVHHHDMSAFWQFTDADSASACCALDTSRARSYWTKQPCSCALTLSSMHSLTRLPSSPIPTRNIHLVGTKQPISYVYPRGHSIKNAVASFWGTLCIITARYDDDLASRLEKVFPIGDGFNPNRRDLTESEIRELKSRRPPIGCRMREVKEFVRRPDEWFKDILQGVHNDNIVRVDAVQWTVLHLTRTFINLARALLDPRPDLPFARLRDLGRVSFYVYKHWLAESFPFDVKFNGPNKDQFASLSTAQRADLTASIRFNSATVLCGVPVHWFLEHGFDVFFDYEYDTAVSLLLEEAEENSFLELAEKVPRMVIRRVQNVPYATEVGQKVLLIGMFGLQAESERHRRYWSPTDLLPPT